VCGQSGDQRGAAGLQNRRIGTSPNLLVPEVSGHIEPSDVEGGDLYLVRWEFAGECVPASGVLAMGNTPPALRGGPVDRVPGPWYTPDHARFP